jgi:hypothetical protein
MTRHSYSLPCVLALLSCVMLNGCGGASSGDGGGSIVPPPPTIPVTGPDVLGVAADDTTLKALMQKWSMPGAAIAVTHNGQLILARGYGYADKEAQQQVQLFVPYREHKQDDHVHHDTSPR